ncbi:MAG TPA: DNA polymerase III subunit chi [Solimonas sp.]|nr:DNA polymerase III subunit chi [Solimonas sp.]
MTRVDFYIVPEGSADSGPVTAARLCDKVALQGLRIYVHAPGAQQQEELDSLLWTQRQGSFVAHEPWTGKATGEPLPYVYIGAAADAEPPASHHGVLMNLSDEVPLFFSRFERVCEFVAGDAAQRARSRERYKFYRDRGYELKTHNL